MAVITRRGWPGSSPGEVSRAITQRRAGPAEGCRARPLGQRPTCGRSADRSRPRPPDGVECGLVGQRPRRGRSVADRSGNGDRCLIGHRERAYNDGMRLHHCRALALSTRQASSRTPRGSKWRVQLRHRTRVTGNRLFWFYADTRRRYATGFDVDTYPPGNAYAEPTSERREGVSVNCKRMPRTSSNRDRRRGVTHTCVMVIGRVTHPSYAPRL